MKQQKTYRKKKVYFLLPSLAGGGSEKVILTLARNMDKSFFDCYILLFKADGEYLKDAHDLKIINLSIGNGFIKKLGFVKLIKHLRKETPDILFSSMVGVNQICSAVSFFFPKRMKFIIRETGVLRERTNLHFSYKWLAWWTFNRADKIIAQSNDISDDLTKNYRVSADKIVKIQNPLDIEYIEEQAEKLIDFKFNKDKFNLISIGRFSYQKGYDILLKSFLKLENRKQYHLTLIGDGELKKEYSEFISKNGLHKEVRMVEFTDNPYYYLKNADIFISSSRWEGLPNAVLESLACGTPVIANLYKGGINEIIQDGKNGFICDVGDSEIFGCVLEKARNTKWDKPKIKEQAGFTWNKEKIIAQYNTLFKTL